MKYRPLLFYSLLAFIISICVLKWSYFIGYDGVFYVRVGEHIFAGKGVTIRGETYTHKPFFYPLLIGLTNLFFNDPEFSGHLVSVLAFSLSVIPVFFLTRRIYSEKAAHWASFLYATNGYLHLHANTVMTESVFTLLILVLLYLLHRGLQQREVGIPLGILIGSVSALAGFTRIDGVLFYATGLWAILFLSSSPLRVRIRISLVSFVFFCFFLIPYLTFVHASTQRVQLGEVLPEILTRRQLDVAHPERYLEIKQFYQGLNKDKTRIRLHELVKEFNLWDCFVKDHFAILRSIPPSLIFRIIGLNKYLFGGLGFFFMGASCFGTAWDSKRKRSEFLFLLFLSTFVFQLFSEFIPKRYFFYFPILLIWMGNGIEVFRDWVRKSFNLGVRNSIVIAGGICLFFACLSAGYVYRTLLSFPPPLEYKEMGLWMKENIPHIDDELVAAAHPSVNFYSKAGLLKEPYFPYVENFSDFLIFMAHHKAKYFVVSDDFHTPILMESYRFLLDETHPPPPGILRLHTVVRGNQKIILYKIE